MRNLVHSILPLVVLVILMASRASAQPPWLTEPPLPTVPQPAETSEQPTVPSLMLEEELLEPPPPLEPILDEALLEDSAVETPPIGPVWYYPWTWIPLDGWENSAELGINATDGNADSFSFELGSRFRRKTERHLFEVRLSNNRTTANGKETQNNALLYIDYDRYLGKSRWSYFLKNGVAYDEFTAFNVRYNINAGVGYSFHKTDDFTLASRFGAGAMREFGGPEDSWVPEALFGLDYEHQINPRNKLIAKIDYFPEWVDFKNFRLVADLAWEHLLDEEGNFSMKLGALDRYDSTPNGAKPNDVNYAALFLYKF